MIGGNADIFQVDRNIDWNDGRWTGMRAGDEMEAIVETILFGMIGRGFSDGPEANGVHGDTMETTMINRKPRA